MSNDLDRRWHDLGALYEQRAELAPTVEEKVGALIALAELSRAAAQLKLLEKLRHKAESKVVVRGSTIYADAVEDDMYAAIDNLIDKLDQQTRKFKDKLRDHHARDVQKHALN